jgi:hypothetical protein
MVAAKSKIRCGWLSHILCSELRPALTIPWICNNSSIMHFRGDLNAIVAKPSELPTVQPRIQGSAGTTTVVFILSPTTRSRPASLSKTHNNSQPASTRPYQLRRDKSHISAKALFHFVSGLMAAESPAPDRYHPPGQ